MIFDSQVHKSLRFGNMMVLGSYSAPGSEIKSVWVRVRIRIRENIKNQGGSGSGSQPGKE